MSDSIEIVQLQPDDWQRLKALRLRALQEEPTAFTSTYEEGIMRPDELWKSALKNPWYFFAESGGKLVGSALATYEDNPKIRHIANVYGMYVASEVRNRGVGRRLLERLIEEIRKDSQIIKISINVYKTQESAHALYQKLGFKQVGYHEKELFVKGEYIDEYEMELFVKKSMTKDTSWGGVAEWYEEHLKGEDTYHAKVIAPNLMRILNPQKGQRILDLACGEGYFTRMISDRGAEVVGSDIAATLIKKAQTDSPKIRYEVANAEKLSFAENDSFDIITCVLALQNMEHLDKVFKECARLLKPRGRFVFVLNHPAFRIPKRSSWGWDGITKTQYRRLDGYLSMSREKIDMSPSQSGKDITWSFHRSLQDYMKALTNAGFAITKIEEWISHRKSEKGPRAEAEDTARKEFPLFLTVEARLLAK